MLQALIVPGACTWQPTLSKFFLHLSGGWDSLQHMEIVTSIEQTFQIDLTADEIVDMTSVGAIKNVLATKGI